MNMISLFSLNDNNDSWAASSPHPLSPLLYSTFQSCLSTCLCVFFFVAAHIIRLLDARKLTPFLFFSPATLSLLSPGPGRGGWLWGRGGWMDGGGLLLFLCAKTESRRDNAPAAVTFWQGCAQSAGQPR